MKARSSRVDCFGGSTTAGVAAGTSSYSTFFSCSTISSALVSLSFISRLLIIPLSWHAKQEFLVDLGTGAIVLLKMLLLVSKLRFF